MGHAQEALDVERPAEVELPGRRLVPGPADGGGDGLESERRDSVEHVAPPLRIETPVVNLARQQTALATVDDQAILCDGDSHVFLPREPVNSCVSMAAR